MRLGEKFSLVIGLMGVLALSPFCFAARKPHTVYLGAVKTVSYSKEGDPSGALAGEDSLKIRALLVDGQVKEWTTGAVHDITDRTFVVRRAIRLNDSLPGDKAGAQKEHWVWQRGPWLMVDRTAGHITALKLPDYEPGISEVVWFRDYAAYCGLTTTGKSLYAVVAQLSVRRPVLSKKLNEYTPDPATQPDAVCGDPEWQRDPLRVIFHPAGKDAATYQIVPGSVVLVEDSGDDADTPAATGTTN
jgi:hypothetical protein